MLMSLTCQTALRVAAAVLFAFVLYYQLRSSLETIHLARNLDFWLPFTVELFSDRLHQVSSGITSADPILSTIPLNRDTPLHLLAVNHRRFVGLSVYLTQLWNRHPTIGADRTLQFVMRSGTSRPFTVYFLIPHCTCGVMSVSELVQLFLVPPLFCVLFGFALVFYTPCD